MHLKITIEASHDVEKYSDAIRDALAIDGFLLSKEHTTQMMGKAVNRILHFHKKDG